VAKATLIEATNQAGGGFVTLDGVLLTLDVEEDISVHSGMLYMNSHNIKVEFVKSDFEDISDGTLENIALKLEVESSEVKNTLFGKKTAASKVKETLTGSKKKNKKTDTKSKSAEEESDE
tara:strand:- start:445 stop:804 length:360 start_codon:yes stop_codon:yes gene_type:complete